MSTATMNRLRRNECYRAATAYLDERGIGFELGFGGKHPFITVGAPGDSFRLTFSGSAGDHRAAMNCVRDLKRRLATGGHGGGRC